MGTYNSQINVDGAEQRAQESAKERNVLNTVGVAAALASASRYSA